MFLTKKAIKQTNTVNVILLPKNRFQGTKIASLGNPYNVLTEADNYYEFKMEFGAKFTVDRDESNASQRSLKSKRMV